MGIIDRKVLHEPSLKQMRDTMLHRGPDDSGLWINAEKTVALAHRRLSVIDLSEAGRQPMSDREGKIWVTYNGEIYNFREIRKELEQKRYVFTSLTDTEVLINAYKEWGIDCLRKFNGMYAFGIYDSESEQLFLGRDRVGKKPLYYADHDGRFIFASELKALIADKTFSRDINFDALNCYLTFGYIPGDLCIFKRVKKLPPAHALIYDLNNHKQKIWQYWELPLPVEKPPSEGELLEELESLFEDAVRIRMISDVPLGAFLSGGLDSSLVVAMMSRVSDQPVKTFSIGFDEDKYNELSYAKIVAGYFRTDHHEIIVKPDSFAILPNLVRQYDEPFADSSMIPTYYLSKATKTSATVALSGDGGDELFGGYSKYLGTLGNYYLAKFVPLEIRKVISATSAFLSGNIAAKGQLLRLAQDPYDAFIDRCSHIYFKKSYRSRLLNRQVLDELKTTFLNPERSVREYLMQRKSDFINCMTYADFKSYLPDDILVKVDRASMLVSLEVRAPLLDYRLAEFSFGKIPGGLKVKRATTKHLLKKLGRKLLPRELEINRKWGFIVPLAEWFRGPLLPQIKEILLDERYTLFETLYIQKLLDQHKLGIDHSGRLFTLLVFCLWKRSYMGT